MAMSHPQESPRQRAEMIQSAPGKRGLAIRWRLTIWITAAFILTLAAIFISLRVALGQILYDDVDSDLEANFDRVFAELFIEGANEPGEISEIAAGFPFPVAARSLDGTPLGYNPTAEPAEMELSEDDMVSVTVEGIPHDERQRLYDESFEVRSGRVQVGETPMILQVGRSTQAIEDVMVVLNLILIGGGAVASLLVLAAGYAIAYRALRPVEEITHTAAEIEASDLKRRIAVEGEPAEVQRLADTFDAMLERLEGAFAQQRNFVMDVSHELRTPLTGLRGNIDVLLMDPQLAPDLREQLEKMSQEVERLIRLTSNLLYLAHAEAGRDVALRPVELDELCLEVIAQSHNVRRDIKLRLDHEERVKVPGDRDLLKQLVLNLVDNAMKYSPLGGDVTLSLHQANGAVEMVVADQGVGIPSEQLEHIFERFYRVENSGSRSVGGAGIGLAISRWIAQVHGGDIRAESDVGMGSRFIVTLPAAG